MAKRLKPGAADTYVGVHAETLKTLASQIGAMKSDMDEARGEMGAAIKNAEQTHGVHRQAFKLALKLRNMEDAPRADFLRALNDYIVKLGLDAQPDMFEDDAEQSDDEAETEEVEGLDRLKGMKQPVPATH